MKNAVYGIANTTEQAESIVTKLQASGFSSSDISVLFPDKEGTRDFAGIGALAIPGVGPFIAAGPIMGALSGAAVGGATGGLIGALVGLGIPELEAKQYEGKVRAGNILISVHAENGDQRSRAKEVLEAAGATDVSSTSEASVPKESRASERVVRAEFDGEVTRGSSDVVDQSAEESDVSPAPVLPSRDGANPSSSTRRPR